MLRLGEILTGCAMALAAPPPEESAGEYTAGMAGVVALLCLLAAQEAEAAAARQRAHNSDIRALFAALRVGGKGAWLTERQPALAGDEDAAVTLGALQAEGDALGAALGALHVYAEDAGDVELQRQIVGLLLRHAEARRLAMPIQPA